MSQIRDTQFLGSAEFLFRELNKNDLLDLNSPISSGIEFPKTRLAKQLIAQFAYDLVEHALLSLDIDTSRALISDVPDLTEWDEES